MKSEDILVLAVRLLGLVFLYHALEPGNVSAILEAFPHRLGDHVSTTMDQGKLLRVMANIGWSLLMAYWLIRGAPLVVRVGYPSLTG